MKKTILAIMAMATITACTSSNKLTCVYEADKKAIVCTKGNLECIVEPGKTVCEPVPMASPSVIPMGSPSPSVSPNGGI